MRNGDMERMGRNTIRALWIGAVVFCVINILMASYGEKYLFFDGSNYISTMFGSKSYADFPAARATTQKLMQFVPVFLIRRMGIRNPVLLAKLFGMNSVLAPSVWFVLSLAVTAYHGREDYFYFLYTFFGFLFFFFGFFTQLESVLGVSNYILLMMLILLHRRQYGREEVIQEKQSAGDGGRRIWIDAAEVAALLVHSWLCWRMNEYYVAWSVVFALMILYRVFFCRQGKLPLAWLLLIPWYIYTAYDSYVNRRVLDMKFEHPFAELIRLLKDQTLYTVILALLLLMGVVSIKALRVPRFVYYCLLALMIGAHIAFAVKWDGVMVGPRTGFIMRFTLFAGSTAMGLVLLLMDVIGGGRADLYHPMRASAAVQLLIICLYAVTSAFQHRTYDDLLYWTGSEAGREGPVIANEVLRSNPYWGYEFTKNQSLWVQILRGETDIDVVVTGDTGYELPDLGDYGIRYSGGVK